MQLGIVAGEASGDLLAGLVLERLRQSDLSLRCYGVGGPQMQQRGFEAWWPHERLAIHGYAEAIRRYPELWRMRQQLCRRLLQAQPDVFLGVDAPDFNLGLEARLKRKGIRTVHFVSPSIWAWRGERVHKIAQAVDRMLCLFPFEPELYERHGIAADYVGHPLADTIPLEPPRSQARALLGLADQDVVIAVLPGSRASEIEQIGPAFAQACVLMKAQYQHELKFVVPAAPGRRAAIENIWQTHAPGLPMQILDGGSHDALAACDVTLIASGTATLEAALFKRPMVIAYRVNKFNAFVMKRIGGYLPWIGLPNILAREFVVPEFLQDQAQPAALATATLAWLDDPVRYERTRQRFVDIHHQLRCGTVNRVMQAITQTIHG